MSTVEPAADSVSRRAAASVAGNGRAKGTRAGPTDKLFVYRRWCKGCGICVEFCPRGVFEMGVDGHAEVADPERCADCGLCALLCPDFAIKAPLPRSVGND